MAHEVSVLFSFRLKFPYSAYPRNPSQTVVATYPPIAGINLLQGPSTLCKMDLRGLDRGPGTPQAKRAENGRFRGIIDLYSRRHQRFAVAECR